MAEVTMEGREPSDLMEMAAMLAELHNENLALRQRVADLVTGEPMYDSHGFAGYDVAKSRGLEAMFRDEFKADADEVKRLRQQVINVTEDRRVLRADLAKLELDYEMLRSRLSWQVRLAVWWKSKTFNRKWTARDGDQDS